MTIILEPELERRVSQIAAELGQDAAGYIRRALLRQVADDERRVPSAQTTRAESLRREFAEAADDPLFLQDMEETMTAFADADAETARMLSHE